VNIEKKIEAVIQEEAQCTYGRNNEVRSCHPCYSGKVINIGYSKCVFVALVIKMQSA
jgi:hypothetical protein